MTSIYDDTLNVRGYSFMTAISTDEAQTYKLSVIFENKNIEGTSLISLFCNAII